MDITCEMMQCVFVLGGGLGTWSKEMKSCIMPVLI